MCFIDVTYVTLEYNLPDVAVFLPRFLKLNEFHHGYLGRNSNVENNRFLHLFLRCKINPEKKEDRRVNPFISFEMRFDLPDTIIDNLVNCVDLKISKNLCVTQRVYFSYIMSLQKPQPDLKAQTRGIGFCFRLFSG